MGKTASSKIQNKVHNSERRRLLGILLAAILSATVPLLSGTYVKAGSSTIIINEVMYDPDGPDTGKEWIELKNTSEHTVNLKNWEIQRAGESFSTIASLPNFNINPGEIILIGEPDVEGCNIEVPSLGFQNGGQETDGVRISNNEGQIIDTLLYDLPNSNGLPDDTGEAGSNFAVDASSGHSLARKNSTDTDNCSLDFLESENPSPGSENPIPPVPTFELEDIHIIGRTVTLDGSESHDPDGEIVQWNWTVTMEDEILFESDAEAFDYTFQHTGTIRVQLTVTDNSGLSASTEKSTSVIQDPENPEITKISDVKTMEPGEVVTIEGTSTAPLPCLYEQETYVQDQSGGIRIRVEDQEDIQYNESYRITGIIGTTYGEKRIEVTEIRKLDQQTKIMPELIALSKISDGSIGKLVKTEGIITKTQDQYIYVSDGENAAPVKIYISKYAEIEKPETSKGKYLLVTGIISRYGTNSDGSSRLRIMPRFESDISISDNPQFLSQTGLPTVPYAIATIFMLLLNIVALRQTKLMED